MSVFTNDDRMEKELQTNQHTLQPFKDTRKNISADGYLYRKHFFLYLLGCRK